MTAEENSKREYQRKIFRSHAKMLVNNHVLEIHTLDIAETGMGITCPNNLSTGMTCVVHFSLVRNQAFDVEAKVIHSIYSSHNGDFRVGLTFSKLKPDQLAAIKKYVEAH